MAKEAGEFHRPLFVEHFQVILLERTNCISNGFKV